MTLALLLMVGPGKLMVGTGPSRPRSGYAIDRVYDLTKFVQVLDD